MNRGAIKISFGGVLCLLAILYLSASFLTGELLLQVQGNWFTIWLANVFQQMDKVGFFNVWSGQSQGAHYLYFIMWKPAQALAENQPHFALVLSLIWYTISVGALFLSAYFFYKIVEHLWGGQRAIILGTLYTVIFLTFQWYSVIDSVTICGLLGAIYFSYRGANRLGGALLGITATMKPMGLVILPVVLKSEFLSKKERITFVAFSVGSFAALMLPFFFGNLQMFMSSFNWQSGRPPWETVYAFGMWAIGKPFPTGNAYFQDFSGVNPQGWGWTGITPVPAVMTTPVPSYNTWYNFLFVVLLGCALVGFLLFKQVRTKQELLWGSLFGLAMYFLFFYGWSPQFYFWLVPFLLACLPLSISIIFRVVGLLEYPLAYAVYLSRDFPKISTAAPGLTVSFTSFLAPTGPYAFWSLVVVRTLLVAAIGVVAWRKLPTVVWQPAWLPARLQIGHKVAIEGEGVTKQEGVANDLPVPENRG